MIPVWGQVMEVVRVVRFWHVPKDEPSLFPDWVDVGKASGVQPEPQEEWNSSLVRVWAEGEEDLVCLLDISVGSTCLEEPVAPPELGL